MMQEQLVDRLLADPVLAELVVGRITWQQRTQGGTLPAVVMYLIDAVRGYHAQGPDGLVEARVQVDCIGSTYRSALDVGRAVIDRLSGFRRVEAGIHGAFILAERHDFEKADAEAWHRVSIDLQVWHTETLGATP